LNGAELPIMLFSAMETWPACRETERAPPTRADGTKACTL
jgi:hypothetical protein